MKAQLYASIKQRNDRLTRQRDVLFTPLAEAAAAPMYMPSGHFITVDETMTFQTIAGFGGALTESAAWVMDRMSPAKKQEILDAYFSQEGHAYNYVRIAMNSCDFSLENYSYCAENDTKLATFSIAREEKLLIPLLRTVKEQAGDLRIFFSPWSPPGWMKTNGEMNHGGKLKPEFYALWAEYYCRFIQEMKKAGIEFWGLTVQNEGLAAQPFDSCLWNDEEERDFIRNDLGPALHRHHFDDLKLMIYDHNRDKIFQRAKVVLDDPEAARYVWGTAYHWYEGCFEDAMFQNVALTHLKYPDKELFFSEGCCGGNSLHLGSWEAGERYSYNIIGDMNHYCAGWVDWNLVLDIATGGPRHVPNACSAPILCDLNNQTLHYQPSYYHIGHFARFVKRGAKRIISCSSTSALSTTAFANPDGTVIVVVLNRQEEKVDYTMAFHDFRLSHTADAHSIETFILTPTGNDIDESRNNRCGSCPS